MLLGITGFIQQRVALGGTTGLSILYLVSSATLFTESGFLRSCMPALSTLTLFYIAALAAVSAFSLNPLIDQPFEMSKPVSLEVIGKGGDWEERELTPRHFLSLLFGYCTSLSLFLLLVSIFSPFILQLFQSISEEYADCFLSALFIVFSILLSQLVLCTLLGVYYLADKIHRH